ncbi:putative Insecticidal toxin complex protein TccB2 [Aspergillus udagawae]|uniref:Insecticidal toxin complex protein TccB2 n=1 Tax=Aspergillus udagawae TaxID=91492 RepID=A0A8E0QZY7_9EURO|nr:putative Insecticidal toxin complex protein TccB2 [Aspergillus udagawae]GIC94464.1 putative Insecticidal toxin complex protein TccB2 [Aspergillus udagawae]
MPPSASCLTTYKFIELNACIKQPISVGGLELILLEQEEMNQYLCLVDLSNGVAVLKVIGLAMNILPNFSAQFMLLGCGGSSMFGGSNLGAYYQVIARGASMAVSNASFQAGVARWRLQALRALQDRILQANMAGYEISNIDKQITTSKKQINQAREMEDFLRQKYLNTVLYAWLEAATRWLYYNTYTKAYDLAKKAEKAFYFERLALQSTLFMHSGSCAFDLPEVLFDMDFPGHYIRCIYSAAVTLPCIVSPYTSINSTLRLKAHKIRFQPLNASGSAYVETTDQSSANSDPRFTTSTVPIAAIHPDSGFRQFDWQSITDLVLSLQYTSINGGAQMMQGAQTAVAAYLKRIDFALLAGGFWAFFNVHYEFALAWMAFLATAAPAPPLNPSSIDTPTAVSLPLPDLNDKLPVFAASRPAGSVVVYDIYVFADHFPGQHLALCAAGKDAASLILVVDLLIVPAELTGYQVKGTSVVVGVLELGLDTRVAGMAVQTLWAWLLFWYMMK